MSSGKDVYVQRCRGYVGWWARWQGGRRIFMLGGGGRAVWQGVCSRCVAGRCQGCVHFLGQFPNLSNKLC